MGVFYVMKEGIQNSVSSICIIAVWKGKSKELLRETMFKAS